MEPLVFPTFETRGTLESTVHRFRAWLTDKVIDLEIKKGTKDASRDMMAGEGVRVVILGHSMGGIVGAEAVLAIAGKTPTVASSSSVDDAAQAGAQEGAEQQPIKANSPMEAESTEEAQQGPPLVTTPNFPYITALLAFDTPYLGLAPSMISHGAETHWNTGKSLYSTASTLLESLRSQSPANAGARAPAGALPAPSAADAASASTSANGGWGNWTKLAMYGGAAASLASAAGAAAYLKRDVIGQGVSSATAGLTTGWTWVTSHLEFVGCLARGEELQRRLAGVCALTEVESGSSRRALGFAQYYTVLGKAAAPYVGGKATGGDQERRFCNMPKGDSMRKFWTPAKNDMAQDEVTAHMEMFSKFFLFPVSSILWQFMLICACFSAG